MGMGIYGRGLAVGGPASVTDAYCAVETLLGDERFKIIKFACRFLNGDFTVLQHRHARGIIAAVF